MPRTPAQPAPDPLADLRTLDEPTAVVLVETAVPVVATIPGVMPTAEDLALDEDQAVAVVVKVWHADPTAQSFGHKGGACGCAYLARKAAQALR